MLTAAFHGKFSEAEGRHIRLRRLKNRFETDEIHKIELLSEESTGENHFTRFKKHFEQIVDYPGVKL
jgi:hypothetical protein